MSFLTDTKDKFFGTVDALTSLAGLVINNTREKRKQSFIQETRKDIESLKEIKKLYLENNNRVDSEKEDQCIILGITIKGLYQRYYCPHFINIKKLKDSEKISYIPFKAEIDKLLGITCEIYHLPEIRFEPSLFYGHRI